MKPINELTIGHIGKRIHVKATTGEVTAVLSGVEANHDVVHDPFAGKHPEYVFGAWEVYRLHFLPHVILDLPVYGEATFEVIA